MIQHVANLVQAPRSPLWRKVLVSMLCAGLLQACGGGGSTTAGVGTGGTGSATGAVSGFGSVLVDGVEYDDSTAAVQQEDATGAQANAELKLGQRVRVVFDLANKAQSVTILAQLAGPVTVAPDAGGRLKVLGQWVKVVPAEGDATQSAPTVLGGYAGAAAISAGDEVEVHGAWSYDSARLSYVLVASRVEKLSAPVNPVLLSGVVSSMSGNTLRLNASGGTLLQAAALPAGLATGQVVRAWVARAGLGASPVPAQRIALASLASAEVAGQAKVLLSGLASHYDAVTRTLEVQGTKVQLGAGVMVDEAALERGEFVSMSLSASNSNVVATAVGLRSSSQGGDLGRTVQVTGITGGIDWIAAPVRFRLRGVDISVAQALLPMACRMLASGVDVQVSVEGQVQPGVQVLAATKLTCSVVTDPGVETVDRSGVVSMVNVAARTLMLQTSKGVVTVSWDALTFFSNGFQQHPESLLGQSVEVEGVNQSGMLRARKVKVAD